MDVNRTTLSIAAGVAGTLFLGYCIYFDKKRRSDPEYKKKIRERKFWAEHTIGPSLLNAADTQLIFLLLDIQFRVCVVFRKTC